MKHLALLFLITGAVVYISCSKKSDTPASPAPTNLTLNATVSTDNSGNVSFTAAAANAVSYE